MIAGVESPIGAGRTLGAAIAGAHADFGQAEAGAGDVYALVGYGRQDAGPLTAAAYGGFARGFFDDRHDFGPLGGAGASGTGGASSVLAGGVLAYAFDVRDFSVTLSAAVSYAQMNLGRTSAMSSGGAQLNIPGQWISQLQGTLGPALARSWTAGNGATISARVSGGWLYDSNPYVTLDAQLFGLPTPARSAPSGRNGGFAEIDFEARLNRSLNVFLAWRGEARPQAWSNQVSAGLALTF